MIFITKVLGHRTIGQGIWIDDATINDFDLVVFRGAPFIDNTRLANYCENRKFIIKDWVNTEKKDKYTIDFPLHLHPLIEVSLKESNEFHLKTAEGKNSAILTIDEKLPAVLINGQETPEVIGWYSKSFGRKEKTNTIIPVR